MIVHLESAGEDSYQLLLGALGHRGCHGKAGPVKGAREAVQLDLDARLHEPKGLDDGLVTEGIEFHRSHVRRWQIAQVFSDRR